MNTWHTKPQGTEPIEGDRVTLVKGDRMVAFAVDHIDPDGNLWDGADETQSLPYSTEDGWRVTRVEERRILPGTVGTATVRGVPNVRVVLLDNQETAPRWMSLTNRSDLGTIFHFDRHLIDFVPDDAETLRAQVKEWREGHAQQNEVIQAQHRTLLDIWHMCEPGDTKHRTFGQDPERVFQTVKAEVERLHTARTLPTREQVRQAVSRSSDRDDLARLVCDLAGPFHGEVERVIEQQHTADTEALTDALHALFEQGSEDAWQARYHEANRLVEDLRSEAQAAREVSVQEHRRAEEFRHKMEEANRCVEELREQRNQAIDALTTVMAIYETKGNN
jgi:hypothetical protein